MKTLSFGLAKAIMIWIIFALIVCKNAKNAKHAKTVMLVAIVVMDVMVVMAVTHVIVDAKGALIAMTVILAIIDNSY